MLGFVLFESAEALLLHKKKSMVTKPNAYERLLTYAVQEYLMYFFSCLGCSDHIAFSMHLAFSSLVRLICLPLHTVLHSPSCAGAHHILFSGKRLID